jgi:hypothetical protein
MTPEPTVNDEAALRGKRGQQRNGEEESTGLVFRGAP